MLDHVLGFLLFWNDRLPHGIDYHDGAPVGFAGEESRPLNLFGCTLSAFVLGLGVDVIIQIQVVYIGVYGRYYDLASHVHQAVVAVFYKAYQPYYILVVTVSVVAQRVWPYIVHTVTILSVSIYRVVAYALHIGTQYVPFAIVLASAEEQFALPVGAIVPYLYLTINVADALASGIDNIAVGVVIDGNVVGRDIGKGIRSVSHNVEVSVYNIIVVAPLVPCLA